VRLGVPACLRVGDWSERGSPLKKGYTGGTKARENNVEEGVAPSLGMVSLVWEKKIPNLAMNLLMGGTTHVRSEEFPYEDPSPERDIP